MIFRRDPLANPEPLVRDVFAYVAYRTPTRADAEDVTSAVFERAVRYRDTYDHRRGPPIAWLIGIARTVLADEHARRRSHVELDETRSTADDSVEDDVPRRLDLQAAIAMLDLRSRELIVLRYGIGLSAKETGRILEMEPNAVDVALHRARSQLAALLKENGHAVTTGGRRDTPLPDVRNGVPPR